MSPKKKLFEADDFDKKKKLFTSSDFDKESEEDRPVENQKAENIEDVEGLEKSEKSNSKNWIWIILGSILLICIICYFIFSKSGDTAATESEQNTELVEETILPADSVGNQEESAEKVLPTQENELSANADDQKAKVNEAPTATENNSNIATATTSVASNANVSNDVEAEAMKVIRGDYGIGQERRDKLGTKYQSIQSRVNELKREGIF